MDKVAQLANLLYKKQPKYEKAGYPIVTRNEWFDIAQDWIEAHQDWSIEDVFLGIKYFNYCFPYHVDMEMIKIAKIWEDKQKSFLKKFDK